MKLLTSKWKKNAVPALLGLTLACGLTPAAKATGTWTTLTNPAPEQIGLMLLLTDGRIMAQGFADRTWYALTPDAHGSYVNGTWSQLASMQVKRQFFVSQVLRNGDVLIAGGEYTNAGSGDVAHVDDNTCEIYHTQTNTWGTVPTPKHNDGTDWQVIGDAVAHTLADGRVLMGDILDTDQALYDYTTNTWTPSANDKAVRSDEESWALLPDGSVLTIDDIDQPVHGPDPAERYIPASDSWISAGQTPPGHDVVEQASSEIGPGMLLPFGSVLFGGAKGHTALYNIASGTWVGGPDLYGTDKSLLLAMKDTPSCVEVNGKVLLVTAPDTGNMGDSFPDGQHFLEYTFDNTASHGSIVEAPTPSVADGYNQTTGGYVGRTLQLPNGQVLFVNTYDMPMYAYTPDSGPILAWKPTITGITARTDGSYLLKGTQFNGLTDGANYGDDVQTASNYPLVQMTDGSGNVFYGRTYNHSTMGVATGSTPVSTYFVPPATLPQGTYSLQVVANGIASTGTTFVEPLGLASLTLSASSVSISGGSPVTGTITLNGTAPSGGFKVALSTSNSAVAQPTVTYVTVPSGSNSTTFPIGTNGVGTVTLKGIQGKNVRTATLVVTP